MSGFRHDFEGSAWIRRREPQPLPKVGSGKAGAAILMEDLTMFNRKGAFSSAGRAAVLATVAAVALTAVAPSMALAGSAPHGKGAAASSTVTDISARRRGVGGGAAAAAAFAGIVGTGLAIAATQNRRAYYDDYDGGPAYYGGGPVYVDPGYSGGYGYYGGGPAYYNGAPDYYNTYRYR
jgi:hypothetical protein